MADKSKDSSETKNLTSLRRRADIKLREYESALSPTLSAEEMKNLLHELRVHQIELEMQNEELRQSQEQLDAARSRYFELYDLAPVGYLTVNHQGVIKEANLTAAKMLNVGRISLLNQVVTNYIFPQDQDIYYLLRNKLFESGELETWEMRLLRAGGENFWSQLQGLPVDNGEYRLTFIDITARKNSEADKLIFEQLSSQLQKLDELRVLSGGIAHDFNNILATIMGNCYQAKIDPAAALERISVIENAAERAAELCRQMLAYAGETVLIRSQVDVAAIVTETVGMLKTTCPENVAISLELTAAIPFIDCDVCQFRQFVMSLITNAVEAIGEAKGVVAVKLGETVIEAESVTDYFSKPVPAGSYLCLEVTDNGCGMSDEVKQSFFESFFSTKFSGRGLGMPVTPGGIYAHRGALQLSSQAGKGTTVKVYLPVQLDSTVCEA